MINKSFIESRQKKIMNIQQINDSINNKKAGTYMSICYKTNGKQDSYKIVKSVVRIVKYISTSANPKVSNDTKIGYVNIHINKDNSKSQTVLFHITKNSKHVPQVEYFDNRGQITKEQYELINKPSNHLSDVFSKRIEDIIYLR